MSQIHSCYMHQHACYLRPCACYLHKISHRKLSYLYICSLDIYIEKRKSKSWPRYHMCANVCGRICILWIPREWRFEWFYFRKVLVCLKILWTMWVPCSNPKAVEDVLDNVLLFCLATVNVEKHFWCRDIVETHCYVLIPKGGAQMHRLTSGVT